MTDEGDPEEKLMEKLMGRKKDLWNAEAHDYKFEPWALEELERIKQEKEKAKTAPETEWRLKKDKKKKKNLKIKQ